MSSKDETGTAGDGEATLQLDDNVCVDASGALSCIHCGAELGHQDGAYLDKAIHRERPPAAAGPQIRARAELFVDQKMVLRQSICPTCYVVLLTEIVPEDEPERRNRKVQWDASQPTRARGPDHDGSGPD